MTSPRNPTSIDTMARDQALAAGRRATLVTAVAFGVATALRVAQLAGLFAPGVAPSTLVPSFFLLSSLVTGTATITFGVWLAQACTVARDHMRRPFEFQPGLAVVSLFVPILQLFHPYRVVNALAANADPNDLPPVREVHVNPNAGYREAAVVITESKPVLPSVPLALWWAMWVGGSTVGVFVISEVWGVAFWHGVSILSAALTIVIVRGVDARRQERGRRMTAMEREMAREAARAV